MGIVTILLIAGVALWLVNLNRHHARTDAALSAELCRKCGYDVRASPERCPECNAVTPQGRRRRLQEEWPAAPIEPRPAELGEAWVVVHQTDRAWEASLLKQHLEARGIACRTDDGDGTQILGGSYNPKPRVTSMSVLAGDEDAGRQVLERLLGECN